MHELELRLPQTPEGREAREELRRWLLANGIDRSVPIDVAKPRSDRRHADIGAIVGIAVATLGTVAQVIDLVQEWLSRHNRKTVIIQVIIGDDSAKVENPPTDKESRELKLFIDRHDETR